MSQSFSHRHNFVKVKRDRILTEEIPLDVRDHILTLVLHDMPASALANFITRTLRHNYNKHDYIDNWDYEKLSRKLVREAEWFKVIDIIENLLVYFQRNLTDAGFKQLTRDINELFLEENIGWQVDGKQVTASGGEAFRAAIPQAAGLLVACEMPDAAKEIHESLAALSRRPSPDLTGAIQHSMAAMECTARTVTGEKNRTFGEIMKRYPDLLPSPLNQAVEKAWGFASERGRHLREGELPERSEVELLVTVAAAVCTYISSLPAKSMISKAGI